MYNCWLQDSAVCGQESLPHSFEELLPVSSTQSPVSIVVNTTPVTVTPSACVSVLVPAVAQQDCVITKTERHSLDPQM